MKYIKISGSSSNTQYTTSPAPSGTSLSDIIEIATTDWVRDSYDIKIINATPIGSVIAFASSSVPSGFLICNGAAISRETYSALFSVIGTLYGEGDGNTTFALPNLTGRYIQGSETPGAYLSAGLPDHQHYCVAPGSESATNVTSSNYLKFIGEGGSTDYKYTLRGSSSVADRGLTNLASVNSPIYGNSTTVQPPSVTMRYYIKF